MTGYQRVNSGSNPQFFFFAVPRAYAAAFWALRQAAQRFIVAALMALKPAADIFRFLGFTGWVASTGCCFCAAHLALCAAAILARADLLIVRRLGGPA